MLSEFSSLILTELPHIEIIYSYAGTTGELIKHVTTSGNCAGIVMAGTGAGRFSPIEDQALIEAIHAGLFVVRSSHVGSGRVVDIDHYDANKFITADNLIPQKARILLMLSLLKSNEVEEIQRYFHMY